MCSLFVHTHILGKLVLLLTFTVWFGIVCSAQQSSNQTGSRHQCPDHGAFSVEATDPNNPNGGTDFCFDVDYVLNNCTPIYIRVVVHFFVDDNCQGPILIGDPWSILESYSVGEVYDIAEQLIDDANSFNEAIGRNTEWYGQLSAVSPEDHSPQQCNPINFVLDDILIHCDSRYRTASTNTVVDGAPDIYAIEGAYNYFIFNSTANSGQASDIGRGSTASVAGTLSPSLFIHESGHSFGLSHTHVFDDGCDDTWHPRYEWTGCDGSELIMNNDGCFNVLAQNHPDCDPEVCDNPSPCCSWDNQSNNVMSYNANGDWPGEWRDDGTWKSGANLTQCQIRKMLEEISRNSCDIVIGSVGQECPPVAATVSTFLAEVSDDCTQFCFELDASYNESFYEIDIVNEGGLSLISTGFISRQAYDYCLTSYQDKYGNVVWSHGFEGGEQYTFVLTVYNECGDTQEEEVDFVLPEPCFDPVLPDLTDQVKVLGLSPNPSDDIVNLSVDVSGSNTLHIYASNMQYHINYGEVYTIDFTESQFAEILIDISGWQPGVTSLVILYGSTLIST